MRVGFAVIGWILVIPWFLTRSALVPLKQWFECSGQTFLMDNNWPLLADCKILQCGEVVFV
jgi:hypothetical protein